MDRAGAETFIMNLYRSVDKNAIQFDFLVFDDKHGAYNKEIEMLGGVIYKLPGVRDVGLKKFNKILYDFFDENQYSVVHSHLDKNSGLILRAARKANIEMRIAHSHTTRSKVNIKIKLFREYLRLLLLINANHRFACSVKAGKWLFGPFLHFEVIPNVVNVKKFQFDENNRNRIRSQLGVASNELVIGHVGRFITVKNHIFILDIMREVLKKNSKSKLVLAGDGTLLNKIRETALAYGIVDNICFLGVVSNVDEILSGLDCFLFPSLNEGFPVTLIEAQANGLECIISDTITKEIAQSDLVTFISLRNSAKYWANKIFDLTNMRILDKRNKYCSIITEAGFDVKNTANSIQKFYDSVLVKDSDG
ncbi:MAG: glycosyltransferase family 1 protein [Clostridiales bacterium]|nr:glycosyltransferase family 1 protein [Clostridiales bacterium]